MDTTQPLTAEFLIQHGADPTLAAGLVAHGESLSPRASANARAETAQTLVNLPPPPTPAAPPPTTNATLSDATVQHQDTQIASTLDATFAPPANAFDYRFPTAENVTDEQLASDSELKTALHAAQMPKFVVESIAQNLAEASRKLANETAAQGALRLDAQKTRLMGMWGKDNFEGNLTLVDSFLEQQSAKSPALRSFLASAAKALTPLDLDLILQVAKYRARAGQR